MWFRAMSQSATDAAINHALDRGISYFDCARSYGDAEIKLGRAIGNRRESAFIATKSTAREGAALTASIDESRQRLGVDRLDLLQLHYVNFQGDFDKIVAPGGALEAARAAQGEGLIGNVGITGHRPEKLAQWLRIAQFDTVLFHLSPVQPFAARDLMPTAHRLDVGMLAMRPTGSGVTNQYRSFLRYVASQRPDVIVSGLTSVRIVDENIAILDDLPDSAETGRLGHLADEYGANFCRRCNYCSCPVGIEIPDAMLAEHVWRAGNLSGRGHKTWDEAVAAVAGCAGHEPCQVEPICEVKCPYDLPIRKTMIGIAETDGP